jgi:CRP-like cAMP-binding protein
MTADSCYLFRNLPAEKIDAIGAISHPQTVQRDQWLFHKGDSAKNIYMVEEGAIELVMPVEHDIQIPVALIRPGNGCVGIGALLEPYVYTLSARCKVTSHLTVIGADDLQTLFQTDPDFGCAVMNNLAQRLIERLTETREEIKIHFMNLIQSATFS